MRITRSSQQRRKRMVDGSKRHWIRVILTDNSMTNAYIFSHTWENPTIPCRLLMASRVGMISLHFPRSGFFHSSICLSPKRIRVTLYSGSVGLIHYHPTIWNYLCYCLQRFCSEYGWSEQSIWIRSGAVWLYRTKIWNRKTINTEIGITKISMEKPVGKCSLLYAIYRCDCNRCISIQWSGFYFVRWQHGVVFANQNKTKAFIYGFSSGISSQCSEHLRMSIIT